VEKGLEQSLPWSLTKKYWYLEGTIFKVCRVFLWYLKGECSISNNISTFISIILFRPVEGPGDPNKEMHSIFDD
jgi:hypothetical protein